MLTHNVLGVREWNIQTLVKVGRMLALMVASKAWRWSSCLQGVEVD